MDEAKEKRELLRSKVRINVTYGAALFVFLGGAGLIAALFIHDQTLAKDTFMAILPVASGVRPLSPGGRGLG